ncbi:JmjC domain containing protein [uncultured Caudovirales phage]|uniref:JmjC domain containing protein n=1 Tax=uncultured Caudovirales phage TaxID=2100421 RepID=A0A6J7WN82_9CAUD|nr:JmjC domain containing protein [uncultured Caudovirales phage]
MDIQQIKSAGLSRKVSHITNIRMPEISWDEILTILNDDLIAGEKLGQKRFTDYGFNVGNVERIPQISSFKALLGTVFGFHETRPQDFAPSAYISLTTQLGSYGKPHMDPEGVIYWQAKGSTRWDIYNSEECVVDYTSPRYELTKHGESNASYILREGDLLYLPPKTCHQVTPLSPRFGISFSVGDVIDITDEDTLFQETFDNNII